MEQAQEVDRKNTVVSGGSRFEGSIHISEEVIVELTKKTIQGIPNIQTATTGIASKFGIGRKSSEGVRVTVEDGEVPSISVEAYVLVKYGQRIPDLAWDVQEKIKANLERYTGYTVNSVNINVQGIYVDEPVVLAESEDAEDAQENEIESADADEEKKAGE
ncbi:Asp23/Gls24 family envelope stress response protein [Fretibacterium sp. OH1220_COT-178]|uniref:Asp23/Gls24 family envelope stress response protein n=1 Tax=Fretibacterium sp. OH1220_COT-178 TaxID=2491047 RepID=UPI001F3B8098|nr:Asp23/Gls24 family envelope stress response protein [Fretibacterium sp. OH1220_COT-178]